MGSKRKKKQASYKFPGRPIWPTVVFVYDAPVAFYLRMSRACANSKKIPGKDARRSGRFAQARRAQKNVGQIGLLGNLHDALFFGFRAPIGSF